MTITYDWKIESLEHETSDGFVFIANWRINASEPGQGQDEHENPIVYRASEYGRMRFEQRPDNLIPYESLTEEIVIGWVKDRLSQPGEHFEFGDPDENGEYPDKTVVYTTPEIEKIEARLLAKIQEQKSPTSESGVPW